MGESTPHTPAPSPTDEQPVSSVSNVNHVKVLIIGSGIAGLSAANHLLQNGCENFRILEARNRIGGRVVSIPLGNQKVSNNQFNQRA